MHDMSLLALLTPDIIIIITIVQVCAVKMNDFWCQDPLLIMRSGGLCYCNKRIVATNERFYECVCCTCAGIVLAVVISFKKQEGKRRLDVFATYRV